MISLYPLLVTAIALSLSMAGAWAIARNEGQSGWTDAIWSLATAGSCAIAVLLPAPGADSPRKWLVAALALAWGVRLGWHIGLRTLRHAGDDPRYAALRREWGGRYASRLFRFLQIQAAAGWVLAMTAFFAARNPAPFPAWSDLAGAWLAILALVGESVADAQLRAFRSDPANRGKVCETGLWGLSRHPNYFCEWLGWVAVAVIAVGPTGGFAAGWLGLAGPAMMYWLLVYVSGIPPLETYMLNSRGEAFLDVQRRIRPFWPIPRRHKES
jgi:steroid 5-alpha reductase family enzyme